MKNFLAALVLIGGLSTGAMAERGGGGRERDHDRGGSSSVIRMRRVPVSRPQGGFHGERIEGGAHAPAVPSRDGRGAPLRAEPARNPPSEHRGFVGDGRLIRDVTSQQRVETEHGRYYWHGDGGSRYVHYYDRGGAHWYGFYGGPTFYWTRWYGDRWWWYDAAVSNWVFWYGGYWWLQPASGPVNVYVDGRFYPYDEAAGGVTVQKAEAHPAPAAAPTAGQGNSVRSADGKRMVQILSGRGDAFLYDASGSQPTFMKFLASGVSQARFSGGTSGQPARILIDFTDGAFALFDGEGKPIDSPAAPSTKSSAPQTAPSVGHELPGPPPAATPPPATGATNPPPNPP